MAVSPLLTVGAYQPGRCLEVEPVKEQSAQALTPCADRIVPGISAFSRHSILLWLARPWLEQRRQFRRVIGQRHRRVSPDLLVGLFKERASDAGAVPDECPIPAAASPPYSQAPASACSGALAPNRRAPEGQQTAGARHSLGLRTDAGSSSWAEVASRVNSM